jgi:hypothetical protein
VSSATLATTPSGSDRAIVEQDEELVGRRGPTKTEPDGFADDGLNRIG